VGVTAGVAGKAGSVATLESWLNAIVGRTVLVGSGVVVWQAARTIANRITAAARSHPDFLLLFSTDFS